MINRFPENDSIQHRTRRQYVQIHTNFGTLSLGDEQITEITPAGDVISNDIRHFAMINGQTITDPLQILGQCQETGCDRLLTSLSFRFCYCCSAVRCPDCAAFDDIAQVWLCKACYKAIKRRRFWIYLWRILLWPFCKGEKQ